MTLHLARRPRCARPLQHRLRRVTYLARARQRRLQRSRAARRHRVHRDAGRTPGQVSVPHRGLDRSTARGRISPADHSPHRCRARLRHSLPGARPSPRRRTGGLKRPPIVAGTPKSLDFWSGGGRLSYDDAGQPRRELRLATEITDPAICLENASCNASSASASFLRIARATRNSLLLCRRRSASNVVVAAPDVGHEVSIVHGTVCGRSGGWVARHVSLSCSCIGCSRSG